ncbi:lipoprotein [Leptospira gomenensis]|uniref:Lipoprotein n=1 Tax=Leptospira gomenensis TaxID=2484974 RepID=A0A5F1Y836_9LEPT|nr:lipoprotein [Leptospira gomenensis]TGK29005.1 lipoprotein [Leptospira gomenensis]TGK44972.1 lipoprotein [Leptospira gomenensis]TGK51891.1 lipoprotein [Leptospira gomenensis]TGK67301.1 lipoprotein [Leptospira gomenensis]
MKFVLIISFVISVFSVLHCSTPKRTPVETPLQNPEHKSVQEESTSPNPDDEFVKATEGFLSGDVFQVVISSLEGSPEGAQELAKKRAVNLLIAEKGETFRPGDKAILKEIVETKGKIVKSSGSIQGKTYFLFQVNSPGLKSSLKR